MWLIPTQVWLQESAKEKLGPVWNQWQRMKMQQNDWMCISSLSISTFINLSDSVCHLHHFTRRKWWWKCIKLQITKNKDASEGVGFAAGKKIKRLSFIILSPSYHFLTSTMHKKLHFSTQNPVDQLNIGSEMKLCRKQFFRFVLFLHSSSGKCCFSSRWETHYSCQFHYLFNLPLSW